MPTWYAPQLNGSEGIKYGHKHDKPQLPETRDNRSQGADWAEGRETRPVTSRWACVYLPLSFAFSVHVSGGGSQEDRDTQRDRSEALLTRSLSLYACQTLH